MSGNQKPEAAPPSTGLVKGLGLYGATSIVAGTMIGTAIFVVPANMLHHVGSPWRVIGVWAFAGLLSLFGALGYSELGAALPEAGGEYVYLHRAYGPLVGFLYGWTQFIVAKSASIAAIATGFLLYLAYFAPMLRGVLWQVELHLGGHALALRVTGLQAGATVMIVLLSGLNILGVRRSGALQTVFTAAKIAVLGIIILLGLFLARGTMAHFSPAAAIAPSAPGITGFGLATISALWAYDGWNNLSMVAGEVENPQRNMPRALIAGAILVVVVYLLVNLAYFYVLSPGQAVTSRTIAADTARHLLGSYGGAFVAIGVLISTFATLNGSILSGSRIPFAQARDGLFPRALANIHPRFRTPAVSIAAQAVVAAIFALSGGYEALYTKAIYSEWIFYALVTASLFVLRRREPELARPYRTWGYPWVPLIFIGLAIALLVDALFQRRADALWCLALVASGLPVYLLWTHFHRRQAG